MCQVRVSFARANPRLGSVGHEHDVRAPLPDCLRFFLHERLLKHAKRDSLRGACPKAPRPPKHAACSPQPAACSPRPATCDLRPAACCGCMHTHSPPALRPPASHQSCAGPARASPACLTPELCRACPPTRLPHTRAVPGLPAYPPASHHHARRADVLGAWKCDAAAQRAFKSREKALRAFFAAMCAKGAGPSSRSVRLDVLLRELQTRKVGT